ncbi:DeoR family transcriptional regulator [Salinarimonas ramus]|uniref:DeoR family transcriptional regulator n=1 Tax=Salinarimonas ramus TaxID=690164 RepID=UPI001AEE6E9F
MPLARCTASRRAPRNSPSSEDTLRRDLRALEPQGVCEGVHGGALAPQAQPRPQPVRERTAAAGEPRCSSIAPASR